MYSKIAMRAAPCVGNRGLVSEKVEAILQEREAEWHRFRKRREERERTREQYGVLFAEVQDVITRHDPMGIIFADAPESAATEYEPEAGTIIPRLPDSRTLDDVQRILDEEFDRWFGAGTASDLRYVARLRAAAGEIWEGWNRYQP